MKSNNYMLFPVHTLEVLHFLMKETITAMTSQHSDLALLKNADLSSYHSTVQVLHDQFNQVCDAMEEIGIRPKRMHITGESEPVIPTSEIHY